MFLFRLLRIFKKGPDFSNFISSNLFTILKSSLHSIGGDSDVLRNFDKISKDKRLQKQFSKIFYNSYVDNLEAARYRDSKIIMRRGNNFRADFMFYSVVFGFLVSSCIVIFFKNRLSPDGIAIFSAIAGISGGCLRDVFGFEFGANHLSLKSKEYLLDESDKPLNSSNF